jgi:hypothetical protein
MKYKTKQYFKAKPLKDKTEPLRLTKEQNILLDAYLSIQQENMAIDMLAGQYAMASMQQDEEKKQKCATLMVERAKILLESAEKLASL